MIPTWLHALSIAYLLLGALCTTVIAADLARHPQHMWIMNVVWPMTALFGTVWIVWQYFVYGRLATHEKMHMATERKQEPPNKRKTPFPVMVGNGALHCGQRLHARRHRGRVARFRGAGGRSRLRLSEHLQ